MNGWNPVETLPIEGTFLVCIPDARPHHRYQVAVISSGLTVVGNRFDFDFPPIKYWRPIDEVPGVAFDEKRD